MASPTWDPSHRGDSVVHEGLILLLMLCCTYRQEPSMAIPWDAPIAAAWDRWKYLHPNIGLKSGNPMVQLEEKLKKLNGKSTPQEHQQSQLTWTPGSSKRLSHQPWAYKSWSEVPMTPTHIYKRSAWSGLNGRQMCLIFWETWGLKEVRSLERSTISETKVRRKRMRYWDKGDRERRHHWNVNK